MAQSVIQKLVRNKNYKLALQHPDLSVRPKTIRDYNLKINLYSKLFDKEKVEIELKNMQEDGIIADKATYTSLMILYSRLNNPEKVMSIFQEMKKMDKSMAPDKIMYNTLLDCLAKSQNKKDLLLFFSEMKEERILDAQSYHIVMKMYRDLKEYSEIISLFIEMKSIEIKPDTHVHLLVLEAYTCLKKSNEAKAIVNEMREQSPTLTKFAYYGVVNNFSKLEDPNLVIDLVNEMKVKKIFLDTFVYTKFMMAYLRLDNPKKVVKIFTEMKKKITIKSSFPYSTAMAAYSKLNEPKEVISLFNEMREKGFKTELFAYFVMIELYSTLFAPKEMKRLFLEIKENNLTVPIYFSLLSLSMVKDDSNVINLFLQLKAQLESQTDYDEMNYFSLLCIFSKLEQTDIVRSILDDIKSKGIKPHRLYYTTLINHYARLYEPSKAKWTFYEMKKAGFKPSIYTYNTLLSSYFYSNSSTAESDVIALINEMELDGIPHNSVYFSTLLGFYITQVSTLKLKGELFEKQMQQIYDLIKQLKQQKMLNLRSYNHILSLYLYLSDPESAISLFSEMIEDKDVVPNIYTYTILMFIFARAKNLESTMSIYNQMLSQGIQPDAATYTALIELHLSLKNEIEALNILDEMKSKNIQPEYPIYLLITSYFAEKDDPSQLLFHHLKLKKLMKE